MQNGTNPCAANHPKTEKHQKSIFSYNIYRTNNFKSNSAGSNLWNEPQVLYFNEKALAKKANKQHIEILRECSTQTSKTILQLAKIETGCISPDSLTTTPRQRNCSLENYPYSTTLNHRLSDFTLEGSCHEQDCLFSKKNSPKKYNSIDPNQITQGDYHHRRALSPPQRLAPPVARNHPESPRSYPPLIKTFLERNRTRKTENLELFTSYRRDWSKPGSASRSKSFIENYHHPNYIRDQENLKLPKVVPQKTVNFKINRRSSKSLNLPDNSFVRKKSSSICYQAQNTFMCPTASSQIKSKMPEIQSVNHLIPPTRRGRSTSPRASNDTRRFEGSRKIPYIDQSKSDLSSATTIVNTVRNPEKAVARSPLKTAKTKQSVFEEDLLKIDDLSLTRISDVRFFVYLRHAIHVKRISDKSKH